MTEGELLKEEARLASDKVLMLGRIEGEQQTRQLAQYVHSLLERIGKEYHEGYEKKQGDLERELETAKGLASRKEQDAKHAETQLREEKERTKKLQQRIRQLEATLSEK